MDFRLLGLLDFRLLGLRLGLDSIAPWLVLWREPLAPRQDVGILRVDVPGVPAALLEVEGPQHGEREDVPPDGTEARNTAAWTSVPDLTRVLGILISTVTRFVR